MAARPVAPAPSTTAYSAEQKYLDFIITFYKKKIHRNFFFWKSTKIFSSCIDGDCPEKYSWWFVVYKTSLLANCVFNFMIPLQNKS